MKLLGDGMRVCHSVGCIVISFGEVDVHCKSSVTLDCYIFAKESQLKSADDRAQTKWLGPRAMHCGEADREGGSRA